MARRGRRRTRPSLPMMPSTASGRPTQGFPDPCPPHAQTQPSGKTLKRRRRHVGEWRPSHDFETALGCGPSPGGSFPTPVTDRCIRRPVVRRGARAKLPSDGRAAKAVRYRKHIGGAPLCRYAPRGESEGVARNRAAPAILRSEQRRPRLTRAAASAVKESARRIQGGRLSAAQGSPDASRRDSWG